MSELPRILPPVPLPPTHPVRPMRETGREPRRPRPEKTPARRRDTDDEPADAPEIPSPDYASDPAPESEPDGKPDTDSPSEPTPADRSRIDLRV